MKVNFFNVPYVLCEGDMIPKMTPDILTTSEICIGFVYNTLDNLSFPVFIYNCLYEYEKDWI